MDKLKIIFGISIPLFIAHGLEEYFTGLYNFDSFYQSFSNPKIAFIFVVLVLLNILLVIAYVLIQKNIFVSFLSFALGILLLLEFIHFYDAIKIGGYYPGLITASAFPVVALIYWKQLLKRF